MHRIRIHTRIISNNVCSQGQRINIAGYAQANARVSTLMHNLEESPLLEKPELVQIQAEVVGGRRLAAFSMFVNIKREVKEDAGAKRKKP